MKEFNERLMKEFNEFNEFYQEFNERNNILRKQKNLAKIWHT